MWPFRVSLGALAITPNELFTVLGAALGAFLVRRRLRALGAPEIAILDFALAGLGGGAVGARLYYFLPMWIRGEIPASALFSSWSDGSGYYGGFLGGALAIALTAQFKKLPPLRVLDAVAAVVPLGVAVGKIGCFLAGCCYGRPTPGGVRFAPGSLCYASQHLPPGASASNPVHPVQLYDLGFGLLLFAALYVLQRRSKRPGEVLAAYVFAYSAYRFAIEFLRDDPGRRTFGGGPFSDSQYTAIALLVLSALGAAWLRVRKPAESAPETPK